MTIKNDLLCHASPSIMSSEGGGSSSDDAVSYADTRNADVDGDPRRVPDQARSRPYGNATGVRDPPAGMSIDDRDYWYALIDEKAAATFVDVEPRTMQGFRQRGGGPKFIRISSRCIRYRRIDLRDWAEARMRPSTSDVG